MTLEEKAAQLGKDAHVDIVLLGTVLEATSEESSKSGWTPSIAGQSVGGNVRRAKGKVTLQGDLIDTSSGKRLASLRVKGEESDTHVGASVYTGLGSIGTDSNGNPYYMNYIECNNNVQMTYDIRWNIQSVGNATYLVTVGARPKNGLPQQFAFAIPVNMRTYVGGI